MTHVIQYYITVQKNENYVYSDGRKTSSKNKLVAEL